MPLKGAFFLSPYRPISTARVADENNTLQADYNTHIDTQIFKHVCGQRNSVDRHRERQTDRQTEKEESP